MSDRLAAHMRDVDNLAADDPCWCECEDNFGDCHQDRETWPPADPFALAISFEKSSRRGSCLMPLSGAGICGVQAIASHTVQRGGGLTSIAESGHVLRTMFGFHDLHRSAGNPRPKRVGLKEASTFPGFCSRHDGRTFQPIEGKSLVLDDRIAFLFWYRALCLELVRKRKAHDAIPQYRKLDAGKPIIVQQFIQTQMDVLEKGTTKALQDLTAQKDAADIKLLAADWSDMGFCVVWFDDLLPATTAFAIQPEFGWDGQRLQDLSDFNKSAEPISMTVTSFGGKSVVVFAWPAAE